MKMRFSETSIRNLTVPTGGRIEASDTACIGLRLRVSDDSKIFSFAGRPRGSKTFTRVTIGRWPDTGLEKARSTANRLRDGLNEGRDVAKETKAERSDGITFGTLVEGYLAHIKRPKGGKASWKNDEGYLKRALDRWRNRPARRITKAHFNSLLDEIAATAPVSANRTQSVLRTLLRWASDDNDFLTENALAGARRRGGKEQAKERVLSDDEIRAVDELLRDPLSTSHPAIEWCLLTILHTACRPGEAAGMRLDELTDLDGKDPVWTIPGARTKNKKPHAVPLSPAAVALIKAALNDKPRRLGLTSDFVFVSKFDHTKPVARHSLSQAVKRLLDTNEAKALKLTAFTPHDLRRTAATLCQAAGVPRDHVKALLNHTDGDITSVYARHNLLPEKRVAVTALADRIALICGQS